MYKLRIHIELCICPRNPGQPADSAIYLMAASCNSSDTPLTPRRPTGFRASGDRRERCSLSENAHIHRKRLVFSEEGNTTSSGMTVHTQVTQMWSKDEIKALLEFCYFMVEQAPGLVGKSSGKKQLLVMIRSKSSHERSGKHFLS